MTDGDDLGAGDHVGDVLHAHAVRESGNRMIAQWADVLERLGGEGNDHQGADDGDSANTLIT